MEHTRRFPRLAHPKISGAAIAKFCGLTIYGELKKPGRRGRARVLIQIRQDEPAQLHVSECLSYTRSVDIVFATDSLRDSRGRAVL